MYHVLSPRREPTVAGPAAAPRLSSLAGKRIGEVWNGGFKGQIAFPLIRELLRKRFADIKIVPYTEFPIQDVHGTTAQLLERANAVVTVAREKGCDALIIGNGF